MNNELVTVKERRAEMLKDANVEIANLKSQMLMAKADNDCVSVLTINGVEHAFSTSQIFIPVIKAEIKEIKKAIKGKPNKWE